MEEETSMSPKSHCDYICCVCGDAATNYRSFEKCDMFLLMIFTDFMGPLLFVTPAEFSSDELSQPTKVSIAMEVEPRCVHLANSQETIASKFKGHYP